MPPCAAMECAGRGKSWKQKHWTLYPNSPSVAAADPPASPDPTMMILYFRLLAGFTSLRLNLCLSQRVSMGPAGILASSSICAPLLQRQHTGEHRDGDGNIADGDEPREGRREFLDDGRVARMIHAQRLEHAPKAVVEMHAEQGHGDDVEDGHGGVSESRDDVGAHVHVAVRQGVQRRHAADGQ